MTYSTLSSSLEVRPTSYGGRGVFARSDLLAGHVLLDVPSPIAHVVYRIFRREACAECFNYNAGETWRLPACSGGVFFCAEECQTKWETRMGDSGMRAWSDVEQWMKKAGARTSKHEKETRSEEETPVTQEDVEHAWMEAQKAADALDGLAGPKARNRVIQSMQGHPAHPDVIALLLSGIITFFNGLERLEELRMLAPTSTPYKSGVMLQEHINSYLALRHLLPPEMKSVVTVDAVQQIAIRDAHNSFGMWSQPEDEGAEMLGFGIWATASFFNHSCDPAVIKNRKGRSWQFQLCRDVATDEEICISYLGELEVRDWAVDLRRQALKTAWGFDCACPRCNFL